jgi:hypothetical protein
MLWTHATEINCYSWSFWKRKMKAGNKAQQYKSQDKSNLVHNAFCVWWHEAKVDLYRKG